MFDNFGFSRLNEFIIQDDKKIINTLLYDLKKCNKSDNKITITSVKFSMPEYKKKTLPNALSNTAIDLFHALNQFFWWKAIMITPTKVSIKVEGIVRTLSKMLT